MKMASTWTMVCVLLAGCGPTLDPGTEGTGSTDGGGSTPDQSADESGVGEGSGCPWQPAPLPGVFDPGPECIEFVSPDEVAPVTIRVVNDGPSVINLVGPTACQREWLAVRDSVGQSFPFAPDEDDGCTVACEGAMVDECSCLAACFRPDTIAIQSGRYYEFEWGGYVWQPTLQITEECAGQCAGACSLRVPPAEGEVEFLVATAEQFDECDDCECTPNEQGWCVLESGEATDPQLFSRPVQWPPVCPLIELHVP